MNSTQVRTYDVAIIGGGIGGSTLAAVLARNSVRVILIEGGGHPRFAIGESTIPETTMGLRILAQRYDVPEIGNLASYGRVRRAVSTSAGVKRNFGFVFHREGEPFQPHECTQHPTFPAPLGPDIHYFRQDIDAYLYQVALSYGATGLNHTYVSGVEFDSDGATIATVDKGEFRAKYVVDAGGMKSILGQQLGLRLDPPTYQSRTRTIYSHFVDVEPFDRIVPRKVHRMPAAYAQGTLHHIFEGGWAWVIPFDNHVHSTNRLCSVGISLDLDKYPKRDDESADDEFWAHVNRFPTFAEQMKKARAVRPYVATTRNQFQSSRLIGDRWCLLPHASDFIDPLFSSGLSVANMAVNALAHRLIDAVHDGDFSTERFQYVETWTKKAFAYYDDLVRNSYTSFGEFELWNAWFRVVFICYMYGSNALMESIFAFDKTKDPAAFDMLEQAPFRGVQGIDNPDCVELFGVACKAMQAYRDKEIDVDETSERILTALRASRLAPAPWGMEDPNDRCPTPLTLAPMLRVLLWGKFASPPHVRGRYFTTGLAAMTKEALSLYGSELKKSRTIGSQATRDLLLTWNRDWDKAHGPNPAPNG